MFYEFNQNNSYGYFITNDKLCNKLYIEANSEEEAISIAEDLGCYWNGVANGIDCPCCGDRWTPYADEVNLIRYAAEGYPVYVLDSVREDAVDEWNRRYGKFKIVEAPEFKQPFSASGSKRYAGKICFSNIEEYAQYMADEYGKWTTPSARIFYKDGRVVEINPAKKSA